MKVLALNASARKEWNSALMLQSAFDGAKSAGAQGELIHLYELDYKGCTGCHMCKLKAGGSFGRCAWRDALTPVLEKAIEADVLLLASPMYFSDVTGMLRMFLERFWFPSITYNKDRVSLYPKRVKTGWIFTMNAPGEFYKTFFEGLVGASNRITGDSEYVMAYETLQFTDYSLYAADMFDEGARKKRREEVFPQECKSAFEMGKRLAGGAGQ
jgi:multimeric flavodoxin WrbA